MPIEFRCTQCNKLLRTPDETAGKQAKCPECGAIVPVPTPDAAGPPPAGPPPGNPFASQPSPGTAAGSPFAAAGPQPLGDPDNPYRSPGEYATVGPRPGAFTGPFTPSPIDIGDIFARTWAVFREQWALCLLAIFIILITYLAGGYAIMLAAMAPAMMLGNPFAIVLLLPVGYICLLLFASWLFSGSFKFLLAVARGQDPSLGVLFGGGPYFLKAFLALVLIWLMSAAAMVVCLLPGLVLQVVDPMVGAGVVLAGSLLGYVFAVVIGLMTSQAVMLIVDRDVGVIDSLRISKEITTGNKLMLLLLWILASVLIGLSALPLGLGLFFSLPFFMLMIPVIYLAMTGQPTADQYQHYAPPPA